MKIQPTDNINFGILKEVKSRSYGHYMWGMYKGKKITQAERHIDKHEE